MHNMATRYHSSIVNDNETSALIRRSCDMQGMAFTYTKLMDMHGNFVQVLSSSVYLSAQQNIPHQ